LLARIKFVLALVLFSTASLSHGAPASANPAGQAPAGRPAASVQPSSPTSNLPPPANPAFTLPKSDASGNALLDVSIPKNEESELRRKAEAFDNLNKRYAEFLRILNKQLRIQEGDENEILWKIRDINREINQISREWELIIMVLVVLLVTLIGVLVFCIFKFNGRESKVGGNAKLEAESKRLETDNEGIKTENTELKTESAEIKADNVELKKRIEELLEKIREGNEKNEEFEKKNTALLQQIENIKKGLFPTYVRNSNDFKNVFGKIEDGKILERIELRKLQLFLALGELTVLLSSLHADLNFNSGGDGERIIEILKNIGTLIPSTVKSPADVFGALTSWSTGISSENASGYNFLNSTLKLYVPCERQRFDGNMMAALNPGNGIQSVSTVHGWGILRKGPPEQTRVKAIVE
jgi:hypothetical protein